MNAVTMPTNPKSFGPNSRASTTRAPVRSARLATCEPSRAAPPRMVFSFRSSIARTYLRPCDPLAQKVRESRQVLGNREPPGLEAARLAGRGCSASRCLAANASPDHGADVRRRSRLHIPRDDWKRIAAAFRQEYAGRSCRFAQQDHSAGTGSSWAAGCNSVD